MSKTANRFLRNDIMSLTEQTPRFDLAESIGPDLRLTDLCPPDVNDHFGDLPLSYGTAQGDPELREAVAARHGVDKDDVVITVGGMHALFLCAFALCEASDEVVVTSPLFPNTRSTLATVKAQLKTVRLTFDARYQLTVEDITSEITPRTKLVSLASPQNPSGVAIPRDVVRQILDQMAATCPDAFLLVDETYREAVYGDDQPAASMATLSPRIIATASLSKCHGAPGLRIGWAISRESPLRSQCILGKFNTVISCSRIDQALAIRVLREQATIIATRRQRLQEGLERTNRWVQNNLDLVEWVRPDAGALCCIRLRPDRFSPQAVRRFHRNCAAEGVRVGNGQWFGEDDRVFRLGFGLLPPEELDQALAALGTSLHNTIEKAA